MSEFVSEDVDITRELLVNQWIPALESGFYRQRSGVLSDESGGFCCLGVLLDVINPDAWEHTDDEMSWCVDTIDDDDDDYGPCEYSSATHSNALEGDVADMFNYCVSWDTKAMIEELAKHTSVHDTDLGTPPPAANILMAANDEATSAYDYEIPLKVIRAGLHLER